MTKKNHTVSLLFILLGAIMVSKLTKKPVFLGMPTEICRAERTQWHKVCQGLSSKMYFSKTRRKGWGNADGCCSGMVKVHELCSVVFWIKMKTNTGPSLREEIRSCFSDEPPPGVGRAGGQWAPVRRGWRWQPRSSAAHRTSKGGSGSREGRSCPTGNLPALQKCLPHNVYLFLPGNSIAKTYDD